MNRAEKARAALDRLRSEREKRRKKHPSEKRIEAKASLSDPDAQLMRFADNAIRAGFNAQIAAVPKQGVIISIEMTDRRNDSGLAVPMVDDIVRRYGRAPEKLLRHTQ